jgi:hypothetical protein
MGGSIKKVLCCMGLAIGVSKDVINVLMARMCSRVAIDRKTIDEMSRLSDEYAANVRGLLVKL